MWCSEAWEWRSHDLAERNPKCPNRAFCSYRLLSAVEAYYHYLYNTLTSSISKSKFIPPAKIILLIPCFIKPSCESCQGMCWNGTGNQNSQEKTNNNNFIFYHKPFLNIIKCDFCLLVNIFLKKFASIALNVLGNWRFFVPDKENTKCFTGTKKCGVVRRGNGEAMT